MNHPTEKPFFVGYLAMPAPLKRFYTGLTVVFCVVAALAGFTIASQQKSPVSALWQTDADETIAGLLVVDPYPVLHRIDPQDAAQVESVLLVRQGKFSADEWARPHAGKWVSLTGYPIRRGGWSMFEVADEQAISVELDFDPEALTRLQVATRPVPLEPVTLKGEVADSKCFLGVMKPGSGAVHKACAEVCLLGGIPAMLVVRGPEDKKYGYMLTQADGSSLSTTISHHAAETVVVSGTLQKKGDLLYIRVDKHGFRG